jgi:uncharacterized SAM-binding protein YcdF (DUF218 family)
MTFSGLVTLLLHPISLFLMGFFLLKWLGRRWRPNYMRWGWVSLGAMLYLFSTDWLLRPLVIGLEDDYPVCNTQLLDTTRPLYIMVLGSGTGFDSRLPATTLLSTATLSRLVEGIRVCRLHPQAILVTSACSREGYRPQAYTAREAAMLLGVDSARIVALPRATNTQQEAQDFVAFAGVGARVIVCTSAIHMPRAMEWFRQAGARPIAAPCDFIVKRDDPPPTWTSIFPQPALWKTWQHVLKEYVGKVYFWVRG